MRFIKFPDKLYRNCPQYVPALHSDQVKSLTKVSTLSYCKRKMWMVMDGKKVAGRICGMINPRYNERYGKKRARFGWFDTIDDFRVAELLIHTAEDWARENGMNEIHGPLYYNTLGKQGMLVEGFENTPPFNCLYNFPYYNDFITRLGYEKECDWLQYKVRSNLELPEKVTRIGKLLKERYNLHEGSLNSLKKDKAMVRYFFEVYNKSFADTVYNFIPFTDEEIDEEASAFLPFINDKTRPGITYREVHLATARLMLEQLRDLDLVRGDVDEMVSLGIAGLFQPHGLGHNMGLDVHDMEDLGENLVGYDSNQIRSAQLGLGSLRMARKLVPGNVVTDEPGIYFIPALIDKWKAEGTDRGFVNYAKLEAYRDFGGIRLEDDVLVTEDGARRTGPYRLPILPEDVEEAMENALS